MFDRPLLLGHRGARKYAPENTMEAFHLALEHGCDGFEFDVRMTSDGQAVVCHDPKFCGAVVARSSYDPLCEAGSKKNIKICRLEDVLALGEKASLNIELKVTGLEEIVVALFRKYRARRGMIVSSFLPKVALRLCELGAEFELGTICGNRRELARWRALPVGAVMVERGLVSRRLVEEIRSGGKRVFVWTVNSAREMRKFAEMGVDGIISDDTKLLVETVGE